MNNFGLKIEAFKEIFWEQNGYQKVLEGLQNTLQIAVLGLLIGIVIGIVSILYGFYSVICLSNLLLY